jgi:hypothetical protein
MEEEIKKILEFVKLCPPNLQEKCFEILLTRALSNSSKGKGNEQHIGEEEITTPPSTNTGDEIKLADIHTKARKLFEKGISLEQINNLFYKEDGEFKPLFDDLKSTKVSESQIRLSLLEAFKNAIKTGDFSFNTDRIKELCDIYKCYDLANFSTHFKNNRKFFMEDYKKGSVLTLSPVGKTRLVEIIKEIAS